MTDRRSPTHRARAGRGSLTWRVNVLVIVGIALVVIASLGAIVATRNLADARGNLADRLDPARQVSSDLILALVDQESGVRGYALSGDPSFLEPWEDGQRREGVAVPILRDDLADEPAALRAVDDLVAAADRWRAEAQQLLATDGSGEVSGELLDSSRDRFDEVRARHAELDAIVETARAGARQELTDAARTQSVALGLVVAALAVALGGAWFGVRRWVVEPLSEVVDGASAVSEGELDRRIDVHGAAEFEELAEAVDAMRRQIVGQLREVEASRENLERSNAELEQFAYVASHDLQEPLRKVASFCQMLEQRYADQLDDRGRQYIAFAVDGAKRMQQLINDLLEFSRVGRTTEHLEPVALDDAAAQALGHLERAIAETGTTVEVGGVLPTVPGDRTLLVALFQNMVANSIKFRHAERAPEVLIHGALITDDAGRELVEVAVRDNGIGIDPRYHDRVFVIFQRLHSRAEFDGTGIGLALCRRIVEFHGGRIWIDESHDGPGTTIRFTLPLAPSAAATDDEAPDDEAPSDDEPIERAAVDDEPGDDTAAGTGEPTTGQDADPAPLPTDRPEFQPHGGTPR